MAGFFVIIPSGSSYYITYVESERKARILAERLGARILSVEEVVSGEGGEGSRDG